jgi:general secretion pathway protein K
MKRTRRSERGVALILVLWLVVVLGAVAAAVVSSTRSESHLALNARTRSGARYAAESGVVDGAAILQNAMASAFIPARQVQVLNSLGREFQDRQDVSLGSARFSVALVNLSARLDLNQADAASLLALFSQFTTVKQAGDVVDGLLDWRDADDVTRPNGAEKDDYIKAGSSYVPSNGYLSRLDDLRRVHGVTEKLALAVAPYVTVVGDLRVDVNAASEPVLSSIPGIGPAGAKAIISRRNGDGPFTSVSQVQALLGRQQARGDAVQLPVLIVAPRRLLLISRGWIPGHPLTHEIQAAYAVDGQRLKLQSWRERDL